LSVLPELILSIVWLWALYALLSAAFALGFRIGGFFDLSVGGSFLVGGYASWAFAKVAPVFIAVGGGVFLAAGIAVALGRWLVAPLAIRLPPLAMFVVSLAVLYIAQALAAITFGEGALMLGQGPARVFKLGDVTITDVQLLFGAAAAASLAGLAMWLRVSAWGRFARSVADDRTLAYLFGIPVDGAILRCYAISGALAGLAGAFFVVDRSIDPSQAMTVLLVAMVAAVLGGHSVNAAIVGALILAALETSLGFMLPGNWRATIAFTVLLGVLIIRGGELAQIARRQI
jgi:branched-subunit amino acid ABC-type transport system permease component